jgi:YggT family protein
MLAILDVIMLILNAYIWVLVASAVFSWLVAFNVVNSRNQFVYQIGRVLYQLTEPVLAPIRRRMPNFGALDLSPLVVLIIIFFLQSIIVRYVYPNVF